MMKSFKKSFALLVVSMGLWACSVSNPSPAVVQSTVTPVLDSKSTIQYLNPQSKIYRPGYWNIHAVTNEIVLLHGIIEVNEKVSSTLLRSENSGKDWIETYVPPKPTGIPVADNLLSNGGDFEFSFLENGFGWLITTWAAHTEGQRALAIDFTKDYGKTWIRLSQIIPAPQYELLRVSFFDEKHGEIDLLYQGTTDDRIAFFTTRDGGITWSETGSFSLHKAFWNGNKKEYFDMIQKYVRFNFPKTPYETNHDNNFWKIESQQKPPHITVFKRSIQGEWISIGAFP